MKQTIQFVATSETKSSMQAAGVAPMASTPQPCAFNIGDTLSFPGSAALVFEVTHRHAKMSRDGSIEWQVAVRPIAHPYADDEKFVRAS